MQHTNTFLYLIKTQASQLNINITIKFSQSSTKKKMFKANSTQTWFDSPTSTQNSITGKASSYAEGSQSSETQILNLKSYVRALQPHPFSLSWDLPYSFHANKKKTLGSTPLYHVYHRLKPKTTSWSAILSPADKKRRTCQRYFK
jgi:hypothetical protein